MQLAPHGKRIKGTAMTIRTTRKSCVHRGNRLALAVTLLSCGALHSTNSRADNLWDLSLADLGSIRVTSIASGTQTPLDKAAAIATVITAEDIGKR